MSGYGGQPPSGWQDPYGQYSYGHDPYGHGQGQGPYEQQPYGAGYLPPDPPASNAAAVGAIVGNCVGLVLICGIGIAWLPGLILGGMALGRIESDPAAARSLTRASWVCCAVNFIIEAIILVAIYLAYE